MRGLQKPSWEPVLDEGESAEARRLVLHTAALLADRQRTEHLLELSSSAYESVTGMPLLWSPANVAFGDAGIALLFGQLDRVFPGESYDAVAHELLRGGADQVERNAVGGAGLFGGLAGFCFAADYLSRGGTRYRNLLAELDVALDRALVTSGSQEPGSPAGLFSLDTVSGAAGIVAYLTSRLTRGFPPTNPMNDVLDGIVSVGIRESDVEGHTALFSPPEREQDPDLREQFPRGSTNCGIAHGVPGPLAALSITYMEGWQRPEHLKAIDRLSTWLVGNRADDVIGPNWSNVVDRDLDEPREHARTAWCYGAPGVAWSLWLSGRALGNDERQRFAERALVAIAHRAIDEADANTILCHGLAGIQQVLLRAYAETGLPEVRSAAVETARRIVDGFDPESLVGFPDQIEGTTIDNPGFLTGASGVLLTILASSTDSTPAWDRVLLLS